MCRKIALLLFLYIIAGELVFAQQPPAKTDSVKLYRDIETFSEKRKTTNFIYRLFFRPVIIPPSKQKNKIKLEPVQKPYSAFEGKIIREIYITTLDPLRSSIADTSTINKNILEKAGNGLHIRTQRITIRNLLLIRKNQPFDSLRVKESERLIRTQNYVHEVSFSVVPVSKKSDSVDIYIREWDSWSLIPGGSASTTDFNVNLTENNFLGFGHEFKNSYSQNIYNSISTFSTNYYIPNIRNTYINSTLHYGIDGYGNYNKSLVVDRPFFSPLARWAAGISLASVFRQDSVKDVSLVNVPYNLRSGIQDYWAGHANGFLKGNSEEARVTRLIVALRYLRIRYYEKLPERYDTLHAFSNEDFYLANVGISERKYVQDKYIFHFGLTEDVPVGKVYELTGGYQFRNNIERLYLGGRYSIGNYLSRGYLSFAVEYGTFFRSSQAEQGVFTAAANYFTDLFAIGNWKFREIVKGQFTKGLNRFPLESVSINNENGIRGFNSLNLTGTQKIIFTLQTQSYAPWDILGFRFGPYLIYSIGILGNETSGFKSSHAYSEFAVGLLIKNEYLVFNYFQLSISFYPIIPGQGDNIIKINSNSTTDFGFRDFIIGKPTPIAYQ